MHYHRLEGKAAITTPLTMNWWQKVHNTLKLLLKQKIIRQKLETVHPATRKSLKAVLSDMKKLIWDYDCKTKYIINSYFAQGIFLKDHPISEYVIWTEWTRLRYVLDFTLFPELAKKVENKTNFKQMLLEHGFQAPFTVGKLCRLSDGLAVTRPDGSQLSINEVLSEYGAVFAKPDDGLQGKNCFKILPGDEPGKYLLNGETVTAEELRSKIKIRLIVERLIRNHEQIERFHPSSLNTMRIITMRTPGGGIEVNRAIMRFGCGGAAIDNLRAGGVAVPMDAQGKLSRYGAMKDVSRLPLEAHPDSHISFEGFQVPYFKESCDLCVAVHKSISPGLFNIGFDVVITPEGPLLLEANVHSGYFQRVGAPGCRPIMNTWLKPLVEEFLKGNPIPY